MMDAKPESPALVISETPEKEKWVKISFVTEPHTAISQSRTITSQTSIATPIKISSLLQSPTFVRDNVVSPTTPIKAQKPVQIYKQKLSEGRQISIIRPQKPQSEATNLLQNATQQSTPLDYSMPKAEQPVTFISKSGKSTSNEEVPQSLKELNKRSIKISKKQTVRVVPGTNAPYRTPGAHNRNKRGKIKRPMNAFMCWARSARAYLCHKLPSAKNADISIKLGQIWASMSVEQKRPFYNEAETIKRKHREEFPDWNYQPHPRMSPTNFISPYDEWKIKEQEKVVQNQIQKCSQVPNVDQQCAANEATFDAANGDEQNLGVKKKRKPHKNSYDLKIKELQSKPMYVPIKPSPHQGDAPVDLSTKPNVNLTQQLAQTPTCTLLTTPATPDEHANWSARSVVIPTASQPNASPLVIMPSDEQSQSQENGYTNTSENPLEFQVTQALSASDLSHTYPYNYYKFVSKQYDTTGVYHTGPTMTEHAHQIFSDQMAHNDDGPVNVLLGTYQQEQQAIGSAPGNEQALPKQIPITSGSSDVNVNAQMADLSGDAMQQQSKEAGVPHQVTHIKEQQSGNPARMEQDRDEATTNDREELVYVEQCLESTIPCPDAVVEVQVESMPIQEIPENEATVAECQHADTTNKLSDNQPKSISETTGRMAENAHAMTPNTTVCIMDTGNFNIRTGTPKFNTNANINQLSSEGNASLAVNQIDTTNQKIDGVGYNTKTTPAIQRPYQQSNTRPLDLEPIQRPGEYSLNDLNQFAAEARDLHNAFSSGDNQASQWPLSLPQYPYDNYINRQARLYEARGIPYGGERQHCDAYRHPQIHPYFQNGGYWCEDYDQDIPHHPSYFCNSTNAYWPHRLHNVPELDMNRWKYYMNDGRHLPTTRQLNQMQIQQSLGTPYQCYKQHACVNEVLPCPNASQNAELLKEQPTAPCNTSGVNGTARTGESGFASPTFCQAVMEFCAPINNGKSNAEPVSEISDVPTQMGEPLPISNIPQNYFSGDISGGQFKTNFNELRQMSPCGYQGLNIIKPKFNQHITAHGLHPFLQSNNATNICGAAPPNVPSHISNRPNSAFRAFYGPIPNNCEIGF